MTLANRLTFLLFPISSASVPSPNRIQAVAVADLPVASTAVGRFARAGRTVGLCGHGVYWPLEHGRPRCCCVSRVQRVLDGIVVAFRERAPNSVAQYRGPWRRAFETVPPCSSVRGGSPETASVASDILSHDATVLTVDENPVEAGLAAFTPPR